MKTTVTFLLAICCSFYTYAQSTVSATMEHGGIERTYRFHSPPAATLGGELPLVIVLHGLGGSGQGMMGGTGFNNIANEQDFYVAYPDATSSVLGTMWNAGVPLSPTVDDVDFISSLIDEIAIDNPLDFTRIYVCGFSMGGMMSHRLACELSDKITAIASMAGVMTTTVEPTCSPTRAVPIMHMHGTEDPTVPYGGNALFGMTSVDETINKWIELNNCNASNEPVMVEDTANDGYTFDWWEIDDCAAGSEVWLYTINGGGHTWMQNNTDVPSSAKMWEFFQRHVLQQATIDLELQSQLAWQSAIVGEELTFELDITNTADGLATDVLVNINVPEGLTYISQTSTSGFFNETSFGWYVNVLEAGATETIHITFIMDTAEELVITAEVETAAEIDFDSVPANNNPEEDDYTVAAIEVGTDLHDILAESIRLYPNPATNNLTIDFDGPNFSTFVVYDLTGRLVMQGITNKAKTNIDVSTLAKGLYNIQLITNDGIAVSKPFVKG